MNLHNIMAANYLFIILSIDPDISPPLVKFVFEVHFQELALMQTVVYYTFYNVDCFYPFFMMDTQILLFEQYDLLFTTTHF